MKKLLPTLLAIFLLTACTQSSVETRDNIIEKKVQPFCGEIGQFQNENWFEDVKNIYQNQFPEEYKKGADKKTFYTDYSIFERKQACLHNDYFIFTPWENMGMEEAFYVYDINKKITTMYKIFS